uniref:KRAB domain-containing protein n=1 Tax=Monodon monoceros TaxID=40151 RepID=A0A8C6ASJ4_MONMO
MGLDALCPTGPVSSLREQALLKTLVVDWDTEAWQRDPTFSGLQRVRVVSFVKGDSVSACAFLVVLSYPELKVLQMTSHFSRPSSLVPIALYLSVPAELTTPSSLS